MPAQKSAAVAAVVVAQGRGPLTAEGAEAAEAAKGAPATSSAGVLMEELFGQPRRRRGGIEDEMAVCAPWVHGCWGPPVLTAHWNLSSQALGLGRRVLMCAWRAGSARCHGGGRGGA
jgi:hypothetical protein